MKVHKVESEGIYEEFDGKCEKYGDEYAEYVSEGKLKVLKDVNVDQNGAENKNVDGNKNQDADKNGQEERIYEQYDGNYEKYISKNEKSSNRTNYQRRVHRTVNKCLRCSLVRSVSNSQDTLALVKLPLPLFRSNPNPNLDRPLSTLLVHSRILGPLTFILFKPPTQF